MWRWQRSYTDLSASRWTTIERTENNSFVRRQCRHCLEPACVSVCPVGALQKTPEGAVVYDSDICMGCRYCMMACPYGIPRYVWQDNIPWVRKCIFCHDKIRSGELTQPACTQVCPVEATIYGERDVLLAEAHRRLKEHPERYRFQQVWGEHEVGGTSVIYLSNEDLGFLTWKPNLGDKPLPMNTWTTLRTVPYTFFGVGAAMYSIHWVVGRRMHLEGTEEIKPLATSHENGNDDKATNADTQTSAGDPGPATDTTLPRGGK